MKRTVAFCLALLIPQAALGDDAIQVEGGSLVESAEVDLSGVDTLVFPRRVKVTRTERRDILISTRKQLGFDGHPPRSMLMKHWRDYLGVMYCRDGKRMYLFTYGEWNSKIEGGASIKLTLSVPVGLQVIGNKRPPRKGPCSAQYPSQFTDEPATESYWYTHTTPPPNWTRVQLTENDPGKKERAGGG